jgi:hypothetical protein
MYVNTVETKQTLQIDFNKLLYYSYFLKEKSDKKHQTNIIP